MELFDHLYGMVDRAFYLSGYEKIEAPVMEYTELFSRSIGDFTDIVQKEMFTFLDRKGRSITLRPEGTAGVIRAYIDNNFSFNPGITKLYYYGPMFRAENPQKGRLREFHQFGCEAIGSLNPLLDVEVIKINMDLLDELGLKNISLEINSVGCRTCRKDYTDKLRIFLNENKAHLCENCVTRAEKNPMRVFDCKNEACQKVFENALFLTDHLCPECLEHFNKVKYYLDLNKIPYQINKRLVRGFDYYTKTVFEIKSGVLGSQNAVLGGGRYDYLIELLGGKPAPAVGAAAGMERILMAMTEQNIQMEGMKKKSVFIGTAGKIDEELVIRLFALLHKNNIRTFYSYNEKSLKAQFKEADKIGCDLMVILGEEELKNNKVVLRDLKKGEQKEIALDQLMDRPLDILPE